MPRVSFGDSNVFGTAEDALRIEDLSGGVSGREPPVPIPNTEVKPASADGTWGVVPWESRSPPGINVEGSPTTVGGPSLISGAILATR